MFLASLGLLAFVITFQTQTARCDSPTVTATADDDRDPSLPRYRLAEIRKHGSKSENPWVIRGDKVYDITDWIPAHPGGKVILRAAGGSLDPYWDIFSIHKNEYIYEILSQYLIGYVDSADLVDGRPPQAEIEDPFADDPERHPALITLTSKPRNAETPGNAVSAGFLTANSLFYVRNHMWVPRIIDDAGTHKLTVELIDGTIKEYTLNDLKTKFPARKVTAALQCSGNRRKDMSEGSGRQANGLEWRTGAISNACWEGALLSDVLVDAGFNLASGMAGASEAKHVQFSGLEAYGASIPIKKAVDPQGDVLLAYSMNGEPLPRDHGFPLRAIVPGHVAARSVKWLSHVTLSEEESTSQWQRRDYKCFGPNETKVDWDAAPAIQEMPVQSAITGYQLGRQITVSDKDGHKSKEQQVNLTGYAYSGGGRAIIRVDISPDNGRTWTQARLLPDCVSKDGTSPCLGHGSWAWKRWEYKGLVPLTAFNTPSNGNNITSSARCTTFVVKATDEAYNTQPESHASTWNLRGNLATAWHRLQICTECRSEDRPREGMEMK